jgi:hypothetical protein
MVEIVRTLWFHAALARITSYVCSVNYCPKVVRNPRWYVSV